MPPLITIGILNYNGHQRLKKVIPSIIGQKYPQLEILVIDNGSIDGSIDYLNGFKEITVFRNQENLGYGKAKNMLVDLSSGEFILMLDNDIELTDTHVLSELLDFYNTIENISFLSIPLLDIDNRSSTIHYGLYYSSVKKPLHIDDIRSTNHYSPGGFIGGCVFFKKEIFMKLGAYDNKYPIHNDDYDLSARAQIHGYKIIVWTKHYAIHHGIEHYDNVKHITWRSQYYLSGFMRMIFCTYRRTNLFKWIFISSTWLFFYSLIDSFRYFNLGPIIAYFKSAFFLLRDLPDTMKRRKQIQEKRTVKKDVFLKIKPPSLRLHNKKTGSCL